MSGFTTEMSGFTTKASVLKTIYQLDMIRMNYCVNVAAK